MNSARVERMVRELQAEPAYQFTESLVGLATFIAARTRKQPQPQPQPELRLHAREPFKA